MADRVPFEQIEVLAQALAGMIDDRLPPGHLFTLLLYTVGEDGFMTHVTNADPTSSLSVIEEWLPRAKQNFTNVSLEDNCWCCGHPAPNRQLTGAVRSVMLCKQCLKSAQAC